MFAVELVGISTVRRSNPKEVSDPRQWSASPQYLREDISIEGPREIRKHIIT